MNKNKTATAAAIALIFAMLASFAAMPISTAQPDLTKRTYAYVGATPNPVGVGEQTLIHVGITDNLEIVYDGWEGLTVTVTKPDGSTETLGPFRTDSTGGTGTAYTPQMEGTYKIQSHFPAQEYTWTSSIFDPALVGKTILYQASDSEVLEIVVTNEPQQFWPVTPLPTEYWSRPINAMLREWQVVSANWIATPTNFIAPYNDDAPETAHVLWAKPLETGGLVGGTSGDNSFEMGDAYEGKFQNSIIINGILYYNRYAAGFAGNIQQQQGIVAVDLRTGEELWFRNNSRVSFGQTFYWDSYNYHGVFEYVWEVKSVFDFQTFTSVESWNAYDAYTGEWMYSMSNVPSGTNLYGPKGEIYRYTIDRTNGWMSLWNSSRVISVHGSWGSSANTQRTFSAANGIEWNVTIPTGLPGSVNAIFLHDTVLGSTGGGYESIGNDPLVIWALSLKPGSEGHLLYNKTWARPHADLTLTVMAASAEDRVFTIWAKEDRANYGFNLDTGNKIWGPTEQQAYLDIFGMRPAIAYGKFFSVGMSGIVYAYDAKTGDYLWKYSYRDPLNEVLWANDWSIRPLFFANGKLYLGQSEHSPVNPLPRGGPFVCIDVETGEEVWSIEGFRQNDWGGRAIIADSIIATMDSYDNRIYSIGKGPSATTVSAPETAQPFGTPVLVKGMVTDVSAGTEDYALRARFPNGVAAISDENMSAWMQYVYMQFPRPEDIVGVEVVVEVLDPNGNYYEVGRETSDATGLFSASFTPPVPGKYTIIASFQGSKAYWPSYAETVLLVEEEPTATAPPPATPAPMTDMYVLGLGAGSIVAIVAIGLLLVLILRKK